MALTTKEVIDRIFKEPGIKFELTEFGGLGKAIDQILSIYRKTIGNKTRYYLKSLIPFATGNDEVQVLAEGGKSAPEEIVRQLWVYKLMQQYGYHLDEIDLEKSVQFGTEVGTKAADIIVYTDATKLTPKIIVECKRPNRKDGIEQLKSYMNAKGAPVAVWSNGSDSVILYRPYPADFDDTLFDIPKRGQTAADVLTAGKTLGDLKKTFNFKKIIQDLEELVLADSGKDEFNEIFKLIFAKIWDELEALESRPNQVVEFRKALDPSVTYERINRLFHKACDQWPGIFKPGEDIDLAQRHLQVCVGPIENIRLTGSNLRIMDDAFEYLLPTEAKKKKGQFFTPRHVVEMCVRMLNPTRKEYLMDPACGSGGFLLHTMEWCYPAANVHDRELRKHRYAAKYLWGIDFEQRAAKTARALMLIAGDGHTNIFGPDVSSLDPRTWYETGSGQALMKGLRDARLTTKTIPENEPLTDSASAWEYFGDLKFDLVLANPPFAGELKDRKMLAHYELAKRALRRAGDDKQPKEERDVLFVERIIDMLKPGGRAAIILPQGKLNNSSLGFIRDWILRKARVLAVVGLHPNTFKPHTGTKTSVIFVQKHVRRELELISRIHDEVGEASPDYIAEIRQLMSSSDGAEDVPDDAISEDVANILDETFGQLGSVDSVGGQNLEAQDHGEPDMEDEPASSSSGTEVLFDDLIGRKQEEITALKAALVVAENDVKALSTAIDSLARRHEEQLKHILADPHQSKADIRAKTKHAKEEHKIALAELKLANPQKPLKSRIAALQKQLDNAEHGIKLLTNRGRLDLLLTDEEAMKALRERWIAAKVAEKLDYPIFMAVSERGGKDSAGNYEYVVKNGSLVEFPGGHPQEGHLVVNQDLVNFDLSHHDLRNASTIPKESLCIAEAFARFAQENNLDFWVTP
jgi:type I restriction enzyme M protein